MTELRSRMIRDLEINGLSNATQKAYIRHIRDLAKYHRKSPDDLSLEDLYQFQYYIKKEKDYSSSYYNQAVAAMKFLYGFTLKKDWNINHIPYRKKSKKLPVVISKEEIFELLRVIDSKRDKTIVYLLYSAGLRVSELVNLKVSDLDSKRMVINIHQGKGRKDRNVMLAENLLEVLKQYWLESRPEAYLFPGKVPGNPLTREAINNLLKKYASMAGITKNVSPHTMRHCFATHMLEDGANIRVIQLLLGHKNVSTTIVYTHVARNYIEKTPSPLDTLLMENMEADNE
ncbi:MAG: tyrosine-type recombinase/integrase [Deltaproteobacteria bacterium]|nr:tyrosine-type recombinase/integrase [Deltaproteobacteria bacterium]